MPNLYGIETKMECCAKLDELLALHDRAAKTPNKATVGALKSTLETYYRKGNSARGEAQMSPVERQYFWPAVSRAFVEAPNLGSPSTWSSGLYEVALNLRYYRPR